MSIELIDLRAKIDEETDVWLDVEQHATGKDRGELVRTILRDHASSSIRKARLLLKSLDKKGLAGE